MGPGQNLWFGFKLGKFPLKMSNFTIFYHLVKKNLFGLGQKVPWSKAGWPLIYCGSKVSSGQFKSNRLTNNKGLGANQADSTW